jgi:hypothetical protein
MKSKSTLLGREVDPEFEADAVDLAADHEVIDEAHLRQRATSCPAIPAWVTAQMKKTKSAKASTSKKAKSKTKSKSKLKA